MQKHIIVLSILAALAPCGAMAQQVTETVSNARGSFHQSSVGTSVYNMTEVIKNIPIKGYPSATFGAAFDAYRYFEKREWKEYKTSTEKVYVTFVGYLKKSFFDFGLFRRKVERQGVEVKFVVFPSGAYEVALISRIDVMTNGQISTYPLPNGKQMLEKILRNEEIKF